MTCVIPSRSHTLVRWYRAGEDVGALLPRLSTYLGHLTPGLHVLVSVGRPRAAGPGRCPAGNGKGARR